MKNIKAYTVGKERFSIFILFILAISCFILWYIFPDINIYNHFNKGNLTNIFLLLGILIIIVTTIKAFSIYSTSSTLVPSLLFLGLGFLIVGIYGMFAYQYLIKSAEDSNTLAQIALTAATVFIGIFTVIATVWGFTIVRKVERLDEVEKLTQNVANMTVLSAELCFTNLPDFSTSHQIPDKSYESLEMLCENVFKPTSPLLEYLEKKGNGAKLHYAKGLLLFADNKFPDVIKEFEDIIKESKADYKTKSYVLYWLGITYRQREKYSKSINCFLDLADITQNGNKNKLQAEYGIAITLFSAFKYKNIWWSKIDEKQRKDILNNICKKFKEEIKFNENPNVSDDNDDNILKEYALNLIEHILEIQKENYTALTYFVKLNCYQETNIINDLDGKVKSAIQKVLSFLHSQLLVQESLNIKASYYFVEGLLQLYNGDDRNSRIAFDHAKNIINEYEKLAGRRASIFSEEKERQVPIHDFIKEINKYKPINEE